MHHIVRDELEVANIDIDIIDSEDGAHLFHDRRTSSLHTISPQDFVDMVRIDIIDADQWILGIGELPNTGDV